MRLLNVALGGSVCLLLFSLWRSRTSMAPTASEAAQPHPTRNEIKTHAASTTGQQTSKIKDAASISADNHHAELSGSDILEIRNLDWAYCFTLSADGYIQLNPKLQLILGLRSSLKLNELLDNFVKEQNATDALLVEILSSTPNGFIAYYPPDDGNRHGRLKNEISLLMGSEISDIIIGKLDAFLVPNGKFGNFGRLLETELIFDGPKSYINAILVQIDAGTVLPENTQLLSLIDRSRPNQPHLNHSVNGTKGLQIVDAVQWDTGQKVPKGFVSLYGAATTRLKSK